MQVSAGTDGLGHESPHAVYYNGAAFVNGVRLDNEVFGERGTGVVTEQVLQKSTVSLCR